MQELDNKIISFRQNIGNTDNLITNNVYNYTV